MAQDRSERVRFDLKPRPARSSAPSWQARGPGFESPMLHSFSRSNPEQPFEAGAGCTARGTATRVRRVLRFAPLSRARCPSRHRPEPATRGSATAAHWAHNPEARVRLSAPLPSQLQSDAKGPVNGRREYRTILGWQGCGRPAVLMGWGNERDISEASGMAATRGHAAYHPLSPCLRRS